MSGSATSFARCGYMERSEFSEEVDITALKRHLSNRKLRWSEARGKQMLFAFYRRQPGWAFIWGIRSGKLRVEPANFRAGKHDHLVFQQTKRSLVFSDARQFGRVRFHHGVNAPAWWETGAPEIVSRAFTQAKMREFLTRHGRAPIKAVLLLQSGFPGIGNWMADEILWRARIAPDRQGSKLSVEEFGALWRSTRFVSRVSLRTLGHDNSDPPKGWLLHERWTPGGKCPRMGRSYAARRSVAAQRRGVLSVSAEVAAARRINVGATTSGRSRFVRVLPDVLSRAERISSLLR